MPLGHPYSYTHFHNKSLTCDDSQCKQWIGICQEFFQKILDRPEKSSNEDQRAAREVRTDTSCGDKSEAANQPGEFFKTQSGNGMPNFNALDIARWFIHRNGLTEDQGGEPLGLLKLLKLLYYAEGCSLALGHGSLFPEKIYAWEHGPAVEEVWEAYEKYRYNIPLGYGDRASVDKVIADTETRDILEQVFLNFGVYSAWALWGKAREEDPWLEATNNGQRVGSEISREAMERYFRKHYVEE